MKDKDSLVLESIYTQQINEVVNSNNKLHNKKTVQDYIDFIYGHRLGWIEILDKIEEEHGVNVADYVISLDCTDSSQRQEIDKIVESVL